MSRHERPTFRADPEGSFAAGLFSLLLRSGAWPSLRYPCEANHSVAVALHRRGADRRGSESYRRGGEAIQEGGDSAQAIGEADRAGYRWTLQSHSKSDVSG